MKKITRNTLAFALATSMILPLTSCGKKKEKDGNSVSGDPDTKGSSTSFQLTDTKSGHIIAADDPYYNITKSEIKIHAPEGKEIYYSSVENHIIVGDRILASVFCEYVKPESVEKELESINYDDPAQSQRAQDIWDEYSGNSIQLFDLDGNYINSLEFSANTQFCGAYSGNNGEILIVASEYDLKDCTAIPKLFVISPSGEKVRDINIQVSEPLYDVRVYALPNGNFMMASIGHLYLMDKDGNILSDESNPDLCGTLYCSGGTWYAMTPRYNGDGEELYIQEIDTETGKLTGNPIKSDSNLYRLIQGETDCFLSSANGIEKYDLATSTSTPVLAWKDTDVNSTLLQIDGGRIASENDMVFFQVEYQEDAANSDMNKKGSVKTTLYALHLSKADSNPHVGKKVLKLGMNGMNDSDFIEEVLQYNMDPSNSARIEIHDYSAGQDTYMGGFSSANMVNADQLTLDMLSGNGPDILVGYSELSQFSYDSMLLDLNRYLDGNSAFDRGAYFDNVIRSFETNGKLYTIPLTFSVTGMAVNASCAGAGEKMTYADLDTLSANLNPTMQVLGTDSCDTLLCSWMRHLTSHFIDYENKTVHFDSEEFKQLLTAVKKYGQAGNSNPSDGMPEGGFFMMNDIVQLTYGQVATVGFDFSDLQSYAGIIQQMKNTGVTFSGAPSLDGIGFSARGYLTMSITSASADPDLAWDFVSKFLSQETQENLSFNSNKIPVNRAAFASNCQKEIHANDEYLQDLEKMFQDKPDKAGDIGNAVKLTQETVNDFTAMIEGITQSESYDSDVMDIIREEAAGFFSGQRSVDDICSIIQNRATTVVNER